MKNMISFESCPVGMFESENGELCVKSEYGLEAIIVSTGEKFWGGAKSVDELRKVKVRPVEVEIVRHGRWINSGTYYTCSVCGMDVDKYDDGGYLQDFAGCPGCRAKMDLPNKR